MLPILNVHKGAWEDLSASDNPNTNVTDPLGC